jgi:hypothetical protein
MGHLAAAEMAEYGKEREMEEEQMTSYRAEEMEQGWEFKILRSATSSFKRPEVLARALAEESVAGWELVEKFDDSRVRLRRPQAARKRDMNLPAGADPYRTQHGISEGLLGFYVVLMIFGAMGVFFFLMWQASMYFNF